MKTIRNITAQWEIYVKKVVEKTYYFNVTKEKITILKYYKEMGSHQQKQNSTNNSWPFNSEKINEYFIKLMVNLQNNPIVVTELDLIEHDSIMSTYQ